MNTLDMLIAARALIADPLHWTIGELARDITGKGVDVSSPEACSFCSDGALRKVAYALSVSQGWVSHSCYVIAKAALNTEAGLVLHVYNDNCTHTQAMEWWDRTIAAYLVRSVK